MPKKEKSFQSYFLQVAKDSNVHRTSLSNGSGFPDIVFFHGEKHSLVELKELILGKRGDRKLRQLFEGSQPPWYVNYFNKGGSRLFVAFRIKDFDGSNRRYGLWKLDAETVRMLASNDLYYSNLLAIAKYGLASGGYKEFQVLKELLSALEEM